VTQTTEKMLADHDAQLKEVVRAQVRMQQDFYNLTDMVTKLAEQVLSYSRLLNAMERRR
jgi:ATP-dependent Clp protease adapter protein ClpS